MIATLSHSCTVSHKHSSTTSCDTQQQTARKPPSCTAGAPLSYRQPIGVITPVQNTVAIGVVLLLQCLAGARLGVICTA